VKPAQDNYEDNTSPVEPKQEHYAGKKCFWAYWTYKLVLGSM